MADLLECLLQLRALHDAPGRLRVLTDAAGSNPGPGPRAARAAAEALADAERGWQASLATALPGAVFDRGDDPPPESAAGRDAHRRFARLRGATLGVLDRCTASDFGAVGVIEGHGPGRVADLIAHMLAHDTQQLGELRCVVSTRRPTSGLPPALP